VFVNIDGKVGKGHQHKGELDFKHLIFYVVPCADANRIYRAVVNRQYGIPSSRPVVCAASKTWMSTPPNRRWLRSGTLGTSFVTR
jgi:hypothetical protein